MQKSVLKNWTLQTRTKYNKQKNILVGLAKKAKRNYYENFDLKSIIDNKKFWASVKLLFSKKMKSVENIFLDESGEIIRSEVKVANVFNKYFVSIGITNNQNYLSNTDTSDDLLKAFSCVCHDLFIEKLNAYGFYRNVLKLIYDYVSDRPQKA